ncbi:ABC transporter ATP-binding protein [Aquifex aeolicus]|uniref:ABC transporter n=1 Tax=Aquifex aeolicus (strain VF5) TaxID=224324 RepID=O66733_AQUAE|nr:ABC transporter ATP-binding protein [Aquifex aeolicus]AAC06694.1 ABC transporter [Aquifex aeolicus VF5]
MKVVELKNVKKIYPDGTIALKGVSLSVEEGEFLGVMGPSGSGKSTLLHLIGGLDKPSEGIVKVFGKEINHLDEDELAEMRKRKIAYVFQFYYLLEDFSVLENLTLIGELAGIKNPKKKALELLDFLRLSHRINHKPYQLSGGEQQRVAIGRALMVEPKLILADEPTGNLDSKEGFRIFELFKELNEKGITFVVATHNDSLKPFFGRIINLRDGEIVTQR